MFETKTPEQWETYIQYGDYLFHASRYASRCQGFQLKKLAPNPLGDSYPPVTRYTGTVLTFVSFDLEMQGVTGQPGFWRVSCNVHGRLLATFDDEYATDFAGIHDHFGH